MDGERFALRMRTPGDIMIGPFLRAPPLRMSLHIPFVLHCFAPKSYLLLTSRCHLMDQFQEQEASSVEAFLQSGKSFREGIAPHQPNRNVRFLDEAMHFLA